MLPADIQLVEENPPFISYEEHCEIRSIEAVNDEGSSEEHRICLPNYQNQEQTPIYLPTNSMGIDFQESSSDEIQLDYEKFTKQVHQIGENIGTVRVFVNTNIMKNAFESINNKKCCINWQQHQ